MRLTKHHGLGNDFLVSLDDAPEGAADLARSLCHRRTGLGADGLIFGPVRDDGSVGFVLYNADGSRAEVSGNGLRCLAQAVSRQRGDDRLDLVAHTDAGPRRLTVVAEESSSTVIVRAEMGAVVLDRPEADSETIEGLIEHRRWATGDIGNPHLVILVDDVDRFPIEQLGPRLEALFDHGANVHAVEQRGPGDIFVRTWERGAHLTEACGSGACVSASVLRRWELVADEVSVLMPGGTARVELGEAIVLTGPSTFVATVEVADG